MNLHNLKIFEINNNKINKKNNDINNNEDNYCMFNNIKIKRNFILSDINSKCIENDFLLYDNKKINQFETNFENQKNKNNNEKDNNIILMRLYLLHYLLKMIFLNLMDH